MNDLNSFSKLFEKWEKIKTEMEELHRQRKKEGLEETAKSGINLCIDILYKSNGKQAFYDETTNFADLEIKPVNLKERISFIRSRPCLFPSYIQLCELMEEQKKLIAKKSMMKKASSPNK